MRDRQSKKFIYLEQGEDQQNNGKHGKQGTKKGNKRSSHTTVGDPYPRSFGDCRTRENRGFRERGSQSHASGALLVSPYLLCWFYGQCHHGFYSEGRNYFFKCGQLGHLQRKCPLIVSIGDNKVPISMLISHAPQGATSSISSSQNHLYTLTTCQDSPNLSPVC